MKVDESLKRFYEVCEDAEKKLPNWKREEGKITETQQPWVSFERPNGTLMHYYFLQEDGKVGLAILNPKQKVNFVGKVE